MWKRMEKRKVEGWIEEWSDKSKDFNKWRKKKESEPSELLSVQSVPPFCQT